MDAATLTAPLSADNPCGEDLSFSPEFDAIADARRFDDPSLSQGEWVTDIKQADWPEVVRICRDLLANRSKDLRIAVWLAEAQAKTDGPAGLAEGYRLLAELCDNYWEQMHPLPEDGDMEERVGNLEWLLSRSADLVREFPLTRSPKGNFSSADLESARHLAQSMERSPGEADNLLRDATLTMADFDAARDDTSPSHFAALLTQVQSARTALDELQVIVDRHLGTDGPGFGHTQEALDALSHTLKRFAPPTLDSLPDPADEASAPTDTIAATPASAGPLKSRAQAIAQLRQVADFFRATEPHSPVAHLADKAARWGEMSLHQWLRTVVKDEGALAHVEELLGLIDRQASDEPS